MSAEKGLNAVQTEGQEVMRIGAVLDDGPHSLPLQRSGADQRHGWLQVRMHFSEPSEVDQGAGPEPVELSQQGHG